MSHAPNHIRAAPPDRTPPTPLWAVMALTFLASIGTGVIWNGISFIAKHDYGFNQQRTLALYLVLGVTYIIGAFSTSRVLRVVERWISPRTALALILLVEAIVCLGPYVVADEWMLWVVAVTTSLLSSWLWPIVESYLTAGRHGEAMRASIGWWNLSWTGAVALSQFLLAPMVEHNARMGIVMLGLLNFAALFLLLWFKRNPGAHDQELSIASVQREYPYLLHAMRLLLPMSYVLNSAMSPLLPFVFERLHLAVSWETPVAATWMTVRVISMAVMWRLGFWHGRWGTLLLGAAAMTLGFGLIVTAFALPMMIVGLAIFGAGMGIIYYAALYYAMSVGRAEVDAGGKFEGLIGVGYSVGPLAGMIGLGVTSKAETMGWHLWQGAGVVGAVWLLLAICAFGLLRPYSQARKSRSAGD